MAIIANIRGFRIEVHLSADKSLWWWVTTEFLEWQAARGVNLTLGQNIINTSVVGGDIAWLKANVPDSEEREILIRRLSMSLPYSPKARPDLYTGKTGMAKIADSLKTHGKYTR